MSGSADDRRTIARIRGLTHRYGGKVARNGTISSQASPGWVYRS